MARGDSFFGDRMRIPDEAAAGVLVGLVGNADKSRVPSKKLRSEYGDYYVDNTIRGGYLREVGGSVYLTDKGFDMWWAQTHPTE